MKPLLVIGSINLDLIIKAPRHPHPGETLLGSDFVTLCGGKGANQAVAAARFGAQVYMLGCVGEDEHANILLDNLLKNSIRTDYVLNIKNASSGVAVVTTANGENTIVVDPGANALLSANIIEAQEDAISQAGIVVLQQEIPAETVQCVLTLCKKHAVTCVLNPAPAYTLSQDVINVATYITPNEHECEISFNNKNQSNVLQTYPNKVIVTEGSRGLVYHNGTQEQRIPAHTVQVCDSTGAGDAFNGVFASALVQGFSLEDALTHANAAAALSTTKAGAQTSPSKEEVISFLGE